MTALREHLAVLRSSMQRTEHWDTLADRIEPVPTAEEAMEQAEAGAWFLVAVVCAVLGAILSVHLWWL